MYRLEHSMAPADLVTRAEPGYSGPDHSGAESQLAQDVLAGLGGIRKVCRSAGYTRNAAQNYSTASPNWTSTTQPGLSGRS